ncbi:TetR/AcrR family transcriptional regulator [Lactobacillus sp. ESL0684]|uniref:TetR/AcrR family transcriptional regulator n=1 Tax=Lactobacillus sp. ESL0684 TaxID=2983213 RepID=UPI0023F6E83E|nr:TetR/AcrR family transcriptional regulator [Lactobacillus sp. ESL0684]WEV43533.1 TetR/AcrR family transcriptional regulator [Lactobacillus sp. ESL0684]
MARRKNLKRRRIILNNTFSLIRTNGMDNVSFQLVAEKSGISKSLLQSYYSHKSKLIDDVVRNILNTLDQQVSKFSNSNAGICARTKAFIYIIAMLGIYDQGLERIILEVFSSTKTLDTWSKMLNSWIKEVQLFDDTPFDMVQVESGIAFVVTGVGFLYRNREKYNLSAEQLADYATSSFMYSFLNYNSKQIKQELQAGHEIIAAADIEVIHDAINTMFDDDKEIVC